MLLMAANVWEYFINNTSETRNKLLMQPESECNTGTSTGIDTNTPEDVEFEDLFQNLGFDEDSCDNWFTAGE